MNARIRSRSIDALSLSDRQELQKSLLDALKKSPLVSTHKKDADESQWDDDEVDTDLSELKTPPAQLISSTHELAAPKPSKQEDLTSVLDLTDTKAALDELPE